MRHAALAGGILATLALTATAQANPRFIASHHPGFHRPAGFVRHRPHVFVGGSIFWDPFFFPAFYPYYLPYPYPYPYPYPVYPYPPPEEPGPGAPPSGAPSEEEAPPSPEDARGASYGLIQLRGVPDGAAVDLDDRFWLTAERLDERWLAVPRGEHTLTVRVRGSEPIVRRIDVSAGKTQVVRFGSSPHRSG